MIYSKPSVEYDRYFHIPIPIVTKHELGLPFPPRNLPITFGTNPSTIFLVIVVTDRQTDAHTDTQTNAGKTYSLAFAGRTIQLTLCVGSSLKTARLDHSSFSEDSDSKSTQALAANKVQHDADAEI